MEGVSSEDPFWDIELRGGRSGSSSINGGRSDSLWLVPTSEDDILMDYDANYCRYFDLYSDASGIDERRSESNEIVVRVNEIRETGVLDTIGGELWEACFYMCAYILVNPNSFINKRTLELGSGLGLPALLLSQLKLRYNAIDESDPCHGEGAFDVCCTDIDRSLLVQMSNTIENCIQNISISKPLRDCDSPSVVSKRGRHVRFGVRTLDWLAYLDIESSDKDDNNSSTDNAQKKIVPPGGIMEGALRPRIGEARLSKDCCDVMFGSALVYSPSHIAVAYVLKHFLSGSCKEAVVIQIRDRPGFSLLLDRLSSLGLCSEVIDLSDEIVDMARRIQISTVSSSETEGIGKEFKFSSELQQPWKDASRCEPQAFSNIHEKPENNNRRSSYVSELLKTSTSAFCILRVWKR